MPPPPLKAGAAAADIFVVDRAIVRVLLSAVVGAMLGGLLWVHDQMRPEWLRVVGTSSLQTYLIGGGIAGALLTALLDLLGLDLPFLATFRRPTFDDYAGADLGRATPPAAPRWSGPPLPGGLLGRALQGSGGPFIAPERAARMQSTLQGISLRLGLLLGGQVLLLVGVLAKVIFAGSLGFFGDPGDADVIVWLSLVPYVILCVLGGWAWRIVAVGFAAATLWALIGLA